MTNAELYIGHKGTMVYVVALTCLLNKKYDIITVRARGKAINKAIDTVEITKNAMPEKLEITDIKTGLEKLGKNNISTIKIVVKR